MAKGYFGEKAGPGAHMRAYVECKTTAQEEGRAYVQYKRSIRVDDANFGGTAIPTGSTTDGSTTASRPSSRPPSPT